MQYLTEITIKKPLDQVVALFDNPDNLSAWQPGLQHMEVQSGTYGQVGTQTQLTHKMGSRTTVMIETVLTRNLPQEYTVKYETNGVLNHHSNYFEAVDEETTRWRTDTTFEFSGFMKLLSLFLGKKAFQSQTLKDMNQFKAFVEAS